MTGIESCSLATVHGGQQEGAFYINPQRVTPTHEGENLTVPQGTWQCKPDPHIGLMGQDGKPKLNNDGTLRTGFVCAPLGD